MDLKFRYSNIAAYSIVEIEDKKYIMDYSSLKGKCYFAGFLPSELTVSMTELANANDSFEIKSRPNLSTATITIMVQPFVNYTYRAMKEVFIREGISQQIGLKLGMFAFSIFLSYLVSVYYIKSAKEKANLRIPVNSKGYRLTLKPNGKRMFLLEAIAILNIICLAFFMGITDGSEGAILMINGIISVFFFIFCQMPVISTAYRNRELLFVRMEEI